MGWLESPMSPTTLIVATWELRPRGRHTAKKIAEQKKGGLWNQY